MIHEKKKSLLIVLPLLFLIAAIGLDILDYSNEFSDGETPALIKYPAVHGPLFTNEAVRLSRWGEVVVLTPGHEYSFPNKAPP